MLALGEIKLIFSKNLVIVLFQSLLAYLSPYKFFSISQTSFFQSAKHSLGIYI